MKKVIKAHLLSEGIPEEYVEQLMEVIKLILTWRPENPGNPDEAKAIVAFSYSYRFLTNGNRVPGPINRDLALQVIQHYGRKSRPVFAQWEIAESIVDRIPNEDVVSIKPTIDLKKGAIEYLSTEGVLKSAKEQGLSPIKHRPILVIAHRFHLPRCVWLCQLPEFSFETVSDPEHMPYCPDPQGVIWTQTLMRQFVADMISRLATYRDKILLSQ